MKLISILLLFFLNFPNSSTTVHEFHVSKCLVEFSPQNEALQLSLHIFIDDLEEALRQQGVDNLFICTEKESVDAEKYMIRYLEQQFKINVDDQDIKFDFIGKETSEDLAAVWCYLEVPHLKSIKKMTISNSILMDIFDDQKNIVNIVGPNQERGYFLFQKGNSTDSLSFE